MTIGFQTFALAYPSSLDDANWVRRMLARALRNAGVRVSYALGNRLDGRRTTQR